MQDLERLITFFTAQYRWGLHPLKVIAALLLPILLLWVADWQVRRLSRAIEPVGPDGDPPIPRATTGQS